MKRLPKAGERYRATQAVDVRALTHWRAPFTSGFTCRLPEGTVVVVRQDAPASATAALCVPEDSELESVLVPSRDRTDPKYDGYHLLVPVDDLGATFERLGEMT